MKRLLGAATAAVVLAGLTSGCGRRVQEDVVVDRAIAATEAVPRAYVYTETTEAGTVTVRGAVADDYRYKALVDIDGTPVFEEVVDDDAVADRVLDPKGLALFATGQRASANSPAALPLARWVVDPVGAPVLLPAAGVRHALGADPIYDSLTLFRYVDQAMPAAMTVRKFSLDDLQYKPREDPFPRPGVGSGVVRYDLIPRPIPHQQNIAGNQVVPDTGNFRKMSVYVKGGAVVQVLEDIDVVSRLNDLSHAYELKFVGSPGQQADGAIQAINAVRTAQGLDPIRVRTMSMKFVNLGVDPDVRLPPDAVVASLSVLENRGRVTSRPNA